MPHKTTLQLDVSTLPPDIASAVEAAIRGHSITIARSGKVIGEMEFRPSVLDGLVLPAREEPEPNVGVPAGATVIVTAMELSDAARSKLSTEFGDGYVVLDLADAPSSSDVLLVPPASPQLIAALRRQFERARIVITEIEDPDMGIHYSGPVTRMLSAGASAYLPPKLIDELPGAVRRHLTSGASPEIQNPLRPGGDLPPSD